MLVVVIFGPICMPRMSFQKIFKFQCLLYMFKTSKRNTFLYRTLSTRWKIFTACSIHVENFVPHTQYTQNIFSRILSTCGIFFTTYSVDVEYFLPLTQWVWNNFENLPSCFTLSTQQTWNNFYPILSTRRIIFTSIIGKKTKWRILA